MGWLGLDLTGAVARATSGRPVVGVTTAKNRGKARGWSAGRAADEKVSGATRRNAEGRAVGRGAGRVADR